MDFAEHDSGKIYLTFSQTPKTTDAAAANDGLNPSNYTLSGGFTNDIVLVETTADPTILALTPRYPLTNGYWQIQVAAAVVDSTLANTMGLPNSWTFLVGGMFEAEVVSQGATSPMALDVLNEFLNPAYVGKTNWDNIMESVAVAEQVAYDNARLAFDQTHISSAVGKYLTQRAGDVGLARQQGVWLTDDKFRQYVIRSTNRKLTEESLLSLLEVFYGIDSVRATCTSVLPEPYAITEGDELDVLIDERDSFKVVFSDTDFGMPGQGTAIEVAAAITRWAALNGCTAIALPYQDPESGETYVKIYSYGIGLGSTVRVTGGTAQEHLHFPTFLDIYTADPLPSWDVTYDSVTQRVRFTVQGVGVALNPNLQSVLVGDYVNITGTEFATDNLGSYKILDLSVEYTFEATPQLIMWFEVENPNGFTQTVTQLETNSISFYRPTKVNSYVSPATSVIVADFEDGVTVKLPATSSAVAREPYYAAYLHSPTEVEISSYVVKDGTATITTSTAHGLSAGQRIMLEGLTPTNVEPTTTPAVSGVSATSQVTVWSSTDTGVIHSYGSMAKINDTRVVSMQGFDHGGTLSSITLTNDGNTTDIVTTEAGGLRTSNFSSIGTTGGAAVSHSNAVPYSVNWAAILGEPGAFVTGGIQESTGIYSGSTQSLFVLTDTGTVTVNSSAMTQAHAGHVMGAVGDDLYVFGGMGANWQFTIPNCISFNKVTGTWTTRDSMNSPGLSPNTYAAGRFEGAVSALSNGEDFMVTGGRSLAMGPYYDGPTVALWRLDDSAAAPGYFGPYGSGMTGTDTNLVTAAPTSYNANSKNGVAFPLATSKLQGTPNAGLINTLVSRSFTVEGWWRYEGSNPQNAFFAVSATGGGTPNNLLFGFGPSYSATTKWGIWWENQSEARVLRESSATIASTVLREWNYWAVTVAPDTAADEVIVSLYINGLLLQSWPGVKTAFGGSNTTLYVGQDPNAGYGATACGAGISQIRVSNICRSATQIWQAYTESTGEVFWHVPSDLSPSTTTPDRIGVVYNSTDVYDSSGDSWTKGPPMTYARFGHSQVTLPTGEILVVGGMGYDPTKFGLGTVPEILRECEIWSPTANRWRPAGRLPSGAGGFVAAVLNGNDVYVVGSIDGFAYKYDSVKRTWSRVATQYSPGTTHRQAECLNDVIVVTGGSGVDGLAAANDRDLLVLNSPYFYKGCMDGVYEALTAFGSTITVYDPKFPAYAVGTGGIVTAMKAVADTDLNIPGPFLMSPTEGVFTTKYRTTLNEDVLANQTYTQLTLTDVADWPEDGYVVINFGQSNQIGPIRYYAKTDDYTILIDGSVVFDDDYAIGSYVDVLVNNSPYVPESPTSLGVFYLTDSPSGRAAAQRAVEDAVAAGVTANISIAYPGDRGLGAEGYAQSGSGKLSDVVEVFAHESDGLQEDT